MKYDFTCTMCSTELIVKRWENILGTNKPWCFCPRCRYKCYAKESTEMREIKNSIDIVHIVVIDDFSNDIVQQQIDTLWYNWVDAAKRVKDLNKIITNSEEECHAYYFQKVVK